MARWAMVLEAFTTSDSWGVRDLAASLGLPPSVVHRILHAMARVGLVSAGGGRGRFTVGPQLARISVLVAERLDVKRVARPILGASAAEIGETVILALYSPERRQFWAVDAAESNHTIRYIWESLRSWSDLHLGASGKGILAFLDEPERQAVIDSLADPLPGRPSVSTADLRRELMAARRDGYVISRGERYAGAIGVSAPVRDATGRVIGDLIASWPDNRTDPDKEARGALTIVAAAAQLSRELGFVPGH